MINDRIAPVAALSPHASPKCAPSCGLGGTSNFCWRIGPFGFTLSVHRFFGSSCAECTTRLCRVHHKAVLSQKKQRLCLLEGILPCSACMPSPAWAVRCLSNFFAVPCLSRPVLRMREPAVWRVDALLTLLPALLGSPLWEVTRSPFAATCHDRMAPVVA